MNNEPKPKPTGETPRRDALNLQLHKDNADTGQCGMAFDELAKTLEAELSEARAKAESWEACVRVRESAENVAPCGHHMNYCHTENGGKIINCYVCQFLTAQSQLTAANQRIESLAEKWEGKAKQLQRAFADSGNVVTGAASDTLWGAAKDLRAALAQTQGK